MLRLRVTSGTGAFLLIAVLGATSVPAQDQVEAPPGSENTPEAPPDLVPIPSAQPPPGIEAIEVTGERLNDANVQDEAQAITAFTGADLDRASIVNVDTLAFNVPGLHVGQSAQAPIITLRGIGTENASLTGEPGVAFHVDGLNVSRPSAARVAFFDLETLDVKRGPQGLLGGKNSTSGSINLVTRKPTDEYEVSGDVLFGNYDRIRYRAAINVPFGEYLATRFAFFQEGRDGYLDNELEGDDRDPFDADDRGLRAHVKVTPADSLELLFSYNYFQQDGNGPQADAVPIERKIWPSWAIAPGTQFGDLTIGPDGKLPAGYRRGCRSASGTLTTVLPVSSSCYDQLTRPAVIYPGRVNVLANGSVVPVPSTTPLGLPPRRTVRDVRRTGQPGETTRLVDPETGRDPVQFGSYDPAANQTSFPDFYFWNPATEDSDPRSIYLDHPSSQRNRYWGWTTSVGWDVPTLPVLGDTQLKLVGGFQQTATSTEQDFDATEVQVSFYEAADEADQYGADLQWSGTGFSERLEWQTSWFYSHEKARRDLEAPGLNGNDAGSISSEQTTDNQAYGAALHLSYALTDALSFSLGGRLIKDQKSTWLFRHVPGADRLNAFRGCLGSLGAFAGPSGALVPGTNDSCSQTYHGRMWGTGLEWRPFGDDHLLYARLDRGYKSGGFRAATVGEYKPERIWAYAAGTKSEFFDQRLRVNLEGFFYNYQDLQLVILDGLALRTENADAKMYGWDLEANLSPIDGLILGATISFLKTRTGDYFTLDPSLEPPPEFADNVDGFEQWQAKRLSERDSAEASRRDQGAQIPFEAHNCYASPGDFTLVPCGSLGAQDGLDDFSGRELSRAPQWKYTLSAEYEIPLGAFGSLTPRVQYSFQDDTYFRAFNRDFDTQEDYHLTNAKLIWTSPEQRWSVEAFIENIEDEAPKQNILIGPRDFGGPPLAWYGPPRFYGVQVGFRY